MIHWIIELILGPRPSLDVRSKAVDEATQRAMKARSEAMRMRFEVITRGKAKLP